MAKTLELIFKNAQGRTVRLSVPDPKEPVDANAVDSAMDLIIARNLFVGDLTEKVGAQVLERNVTEITFG